MYLNTDLNMVLTRGGDVVLSFRLPHGVLNFVQEVKGVDAIDFSVVFIAADALDWFRVHLRLRFVCLGHVVELADIQVADDLHRARTRILQEGIFIHSSSSRLLVEERLGNCVDGERSRYDA